MKPRTVAAFVVVYTVLVLAGAELAIHVWGLRKALVLQGDELRRARPVYDAIVKADDMSEREKTPQAAKDSQNNRAEYDLFTVAGTLRTPLGRGALTIFRDYLDAVEEMPRKDRACDAAKFNAHIAEDAYYGHRLGDDEFFDAETTFYKCLSERGQLRGIITACRQEAYTLVTGNFPPPTSTCVFRHDSPTQDSRRGL